METTPQQTISDYLSAYQKFVETTTFNPKITKCLFVNAYNQFFSGKILAEKGLITQSNNCLRMGLESGWLGLILMKDPQLGMQWAFGLGDDNVKKSLIKLEKPFQIRKILGDTTRITVQDRDDIYSALSDKSHTKLSSVVRPYISPNAPPSDGFIDCIPMGGIKGKNNITRILNSVTTVLTFALAEIEDSLKHQLMEENWTWNRSDLMKITGGGFNVKDGTFEPHISSKGHPGSDPIQAMALLSAIRHGDI